MPITHRFLVVALTSVLIGTMATLAGFTRLKTRIGGQLPRFILTRSRKKSLAKLVDLPIEILVEILLLLEWKDILRVRQTCQRLRDASLAKPVWLGLVQWYSSTVQPRPFFPEKPLALYTGLELERLILRWQSGRIGCTRPQPEQRAFTIPETYFRGAYLIEGGRWFLFGSRDGSIKYYDLNVPGETSELEAVTLIPTFFDKHANTAIKLSVDIDLDAEYLTFNLGVMTSRLPSVTGDSDYPNAPRFARWIQVSRVTCDWDENGRVKGLRSEQLACFREEYLGGFDSFTLGGRYVAYSMHSYQTSSTEGDGKNIVVVDWTLADPTSLAYPRKFLWRRRVQWLTLLPDDKLVCNDSSSILLFDLRDAVVTTLLPTQRNQPPAQPPIASFDLTVIAISRPYIVHDSIRFSALTFEGIKGIIIPCSQGVSRTMDCVDLISEPNNIIYAYLNYDRAMVYYGPDATMLQYAWPDEVSSPFIRQRTAIQAEYSPKCYFDSSASRIVIQATSIMSIVDLV